MAAVIDSWEVTEAPQSTAPSADTGALTLVMVEIDQDWMERAHIVVPEVGGETAQEWASEDILTPEVLEEFHRASEQLLARRPE
jgi:hypothetical protein